MAAICWIACAGLAFGVVGARLGALRLGALLAGAAAGSALLPWVGPAAAAALAALAGRDTWAGAAAGWVAAYTAVAVAVSGLLLRALARVRGANQAAPRSRLAGAATGTGFGILLAWAVFGNLPDLVLGTLPPTGNDAAVSAIRRPFEVLRALRVLRSLDAKEAAWLASRPDVEAVVRSEPLQALLRTPGMLRKFSRAADGDWAALAELAADAAVKSAMDEPSFLARVREVDLVTLAAAVERRRAGGAGEVMEAPLPPQVLHSELRDRLAAEWEAGSTAASAAGAHAPGVPDAAAAYWKGVERALKVFDRPAGVPLWVPVVSAPSATLR